MNQEKLARHIQSYIENRRQKPEKYGAMDRERAQHLAHIQSLTPGRIQELDEHGLYEALAPLWALLMWGNKHHLVDKIVKDNGVPKLRVELGQLLYGQEPIERRWDRFRDQVSWIGPAIASELLGHLHPGEFAIWNRRAQAAFDYLEVPHVPKYQYQLTGAVYKTLCSTSERIAKELREAGFKDADLLSVDYFIWDELQIEEPPAKKPGDPKHGPEPKTPTEAKLIHNEIRDKVKEIGEWLGFTAATEVVVADGSRVDTIWEATIGNMGRVIYVFEIQVHGSVDSLLMNLLKAKNNPAVQGVVAVSSEVELEKIRKHAAGVGILASQLRYWDYLGVLECHQHLEAANEQINALGLVPKPF